METMESKPSHTGPTRAEPVDPPRPAPQPDPPRPEQAEVEEPGYGHGV